jgi:hypothetical protein
MDGASGVLVCIEGKEGMASLYLQFTSSGSAIQLNGEAVAERVRQGFSSYVTDSECSLSTMGGQRCTQGIMLHRYRFAQERRGTSPVNRWRVREWQYI